MMQRLSARIYLRPPNKNSDTHYAETLLTRPAGGGSRWTLEVTVNGNDSDNFNFMRRMSPATITTPSVKAAKEAALSKVREAASRALGGRPEGFQLGVKDWSDFSD